jgi:hypothetical protein
MKNAESHVPIFKLCKASPAEPTQHRLHLLDHPARTNIWLHMFTALHSHRIMGKAQNKKILEHIASGGQLPCLLCVARLWSMVVDGVVSEV